MIRQTYYIHVITPCFSGGAEPEKCAEIRSSSIRGQLRWWFRVLGGFKSLAYLELSQQESLLFGSIAGDTGVAGKLTVRVRSLPPSVNIVDDEAMNASPGSDRGYLLFPLRPEKKGRPEERRRDRGVLKQGEGIAKLPVFTMEFIWRGDQRLANDLRSLATVFSHLGSLGFRSRRAMGALASDLTLADCAKSLDFFNSPQNLTIYSLPCGNAEGAILTLARWLKSWRAHGRSGQNSQEQAYPGFLFAKHDHDVALHGGPLGYRASLGLPLLTKYGNWNAQRPPAGKQTAGRFASPVILRPHKDPNNNWCALIIFVDSKKWNPTDPVYLNGHRKSVSLDLYNAMKADPNLRPFP